MFNLYSSNRLEELAKLLGGTVNGRSSDPRNIFIPEMIVVQSRGMARYLNFQMAENHGIAANCQYLLPDAMLDKLFDALLPERNLPGNGPFTREKMMWLIAAMLPRMLDDDDFIPLRSYLGNSPAKERSIKTFQLAARIAKVFAHYMTFRPRMVCSDANAWREAAKNNKHWLWQYKLFKALEDAAPGSSHIAGLHDELLRALNSISAERFAKLIPWQRLSVFGIVQLPKFHLEILEALGRLMKVNVYYLSASSEYLGEIDNPLKKSRMDLAGLDAYSDCPNQLLAMFGTAKIEFFEQLNECEFNSAEEQFVPTTDDTVLAGIQNNILELKDAHFEGRLNISVNACAGIRREVEILNDYLLDLLASGKVGVEQIVVMTPDIHKYAPFIEAVFDNCELPERRIAYSIADRKGHSKNSPVNALLDILSIDSRRYSLAALQSLLEHDVIRRRFNLSVPESERVFELFKTAAGRWGIDGQYREDVSKVNFAESSLRRAMRKLMLAYSFGIGKTQSGSLSLYENSLSFDIPVRPDDAESLGKFSHFAEKLYALHEQKILDTEKSPAAWANFIRAAADDFIDSGNGAGDIEISILQNFISNLNEVYNNGFFRETLPLEPIVELLGKSLDTYRMSGGYMHHGITFCELLPMRSIPFKTVCLLGMNDGEFPRREVKDNFDLTANRRRRGDRDQTLEDKALFLDALLSARETLYISYNGIDENSAESIAPSHLVCELLDYLKEFGSTNINDVLREHPLQGFSRAYFNASDPRLYSYSIQNLALAETLENPAPSEHSAVSIPATDEVPPEIELEDMIVFFKNPVKYFLRRQLAIYQLDDDDCESPEHETFEPDPLERYAIRREIMKQLLEGNAALDETSLKRTAAFFRDKGLLPPAPNDLPLIDSIHDECQALLQKIIAARGQRKRDEDIEFTIELPQIKISGRIEDIYENIHTPYSLSKNSSVHQIRCLLEHLCLNAGDEKSSLCVFRDSKELLLEPLAADNALEGLSKLTAMYLRGSHSPLPFLPDFSGDIVDYGFEEAAKRWSKKDFYSFRTFEFDSIDWQLCFPGQIKDYAKEFTRCAEDFYNIFNSAENKP